MQQRGPWTPEMDVTQEELLEAIAGAKELSFTPGSRWVYNDANYLLLGAIVEHTTGHTLSDHLQQTFFDPLDLAMTLEWPGPPDRTCSYRGNANGQFEIADVAGEAPGPTGIRSSPTELVRWGDNYRTGAVGGLLVTEPERDAVDGAFDDSSYGFGIMIRPIRPSGTVASPAASSACSGCCRAGRWPSLSPATAWPSSRTTSPVP